MAPDHRPTPATIIGELLATHCEAQSLLAEASHCQALVVCSAVITQVKSAAARAGRLEYEELRHRLEPRRRRPVNFGVGLLLLLIVSAGLALLVLIELSGLLDGVTPVLSALSATAVWLTIAWLGGLVVRQRRWASAAAVGGIALLLELLLGALYGLGPRWLADGSRSHGSMVFGALTGTFILVLTAGAAVLMDHMEPASLLMARQRWRHANAAYEEALATEHADAEAAAIAVVAWLSLVRAHVTVLAAADEYLVEDTLGLAATLVESGRPPPPLRPGLPQPG
jgi:hypothetical protein